MKVLTGKERFPSRAAPVYGLGYEFEVLGLVLLNAGALQAFRTRKRTDIQFDTVPRKNVRVKQKTGAKRWSGILASAGICPTAGERLKLAG
jgi:hypothetical protein